MPLVLSVVASLCLTAPLVYYELVLLRESTVVFVGLAIIWMTGLAFRRDDRLSFFALGATIGVGTLLKGSLLIYAVGLGAAVVVLYRHRPAKGAWAAGLLLSGVLVALAPLVARNLAVGVPPFWLASSGQLTFVVSNEPSNQPSAGNYINSAVLARFLGETDGGWPAAVSTALNGHSVVSYLRLIGEKAYWAWHWYELPNNDNFYFRRLRIPVLRWLPVTAWMISPLALAGLLLGFPFVRRAWPLYLHLILSLLLLLVFYVLGRFRVGLLAAAIPFAALAIVELASAVRARRSRRLLGICAGVAIMMFWTSQPLHSGMRLIRTDDWLLPYAARYQPRLQVAVERGDFGSAALVCDESFTEAPTATELRHAADASLVSILADMRRGCAALWTRAGNPARAQEQAQMADQIR